MAFCSNCGHQLTEDAKFCSKCGMSVPTPLNDHSARRITYEGEIYKCPNCGEVLKSFAAVCPACGYEIRGNHVSGTVSEFSNKLEQAHTLEQKVELIRSFPIANNKEDVFEFIILASTNLTNDMPRDLYKAWVSKFEQSYRKAKVMFEGTADFEVIQKIYDETQKKIKKENFVHGAKTAQNSIVKASGVLSNVLTVLLTNAGVFAGVFFLIWSIKIYDAYGNGSMHELIGEILLIASSVILLRRRAHLYEYLLTIFGGGLSVYLSRFLDNGSMLELGGWLTIIITAVNFFRSFSYVNMQTKSKRPTYTHETGEVSSEIVTEDELVTVPLSALFFSEKNYGVVASLFEHAGFTNIKTVPLHDLHKGFFRRAEERTSDLVAAIHINGKPLTVFKRTFPANSAVVISYHSFQN